MSVRDKVTTFMVTELNKLFPEWDVICAKQNYPKLPEQYLVVDLLAERNIGNQERWDLTAEEIAVVGLCEATFNIQGFGEGAIETLGMIGMHLERPTIVDDFFIANIAVNNVSDVQDLTELLDDTTWQERASVDVTISYDRSVIDDPGWFDTVVLHGVLSRGGDEPMPGKSGIKIETQIDIE